jgi:plastocyanin
MNKGDAVLPDGAQPWDSGIITGGQTYSHTFDVAGQYSYFCIPHEALGMVGKITVNG